MKNKITVITSTVPSSLTKQFSLSGDGSLQKITSGNLCQGQADVTEIDGPSDFAELLETLQPNQALTFGTPLPGSCEIITKDQWNREGQPKGKATRTEDHFFFAPGPGIMMLDYDPPEGVAPYSRDELLAALEHACPGLTSGGWVWYPSSSSYIHNSATGEELTGLGGQRLYLFVQSSADIPRAGKALGDLFWLKGFGRIEISVSGARLVRSLVDMSVFQASRLDFAAGADCGAGLEQRRGKPVVQLGDPINTVKVIDLKKMDQRDAKNLRTDALDSSEENAKHVRNKYVLGRATEECGPGATKDDIELASARIVDVLEFKLLTQDSIVHTIQSGSVVPVSISDIMANRIDYHNVQCLDPAEPSYRDHSHCGIIWSDSDTPGIYSFAHGGRTYRIDVPDANAPDPADPSVYGIEMHCMNSKKGERTYYMKNCTKYVALNRSDAPIQLIRHGVPDDKLDNGLSLPEEILYKMQFENPIAFAGVIAGYDAGRHRLNNQEVLNLEGFTLPQPTAGDWPLLREILSGLFVDQDNMHRFCAFAYHAWASMDKRKWAPMPALALCGPRDSGKSLIVHVLNMLLGGYPIGRGYNYLKAGTQFNYDLLGSVLLVADDEAVSKDMRSRMGMMAKVKQLAVLNDHKVESKGVDAVTIPTMWRICLCCNDEAEHMQVLPPIDDSVADKFLLLRVNRSDMPMQTNTPETREAFSDALQAELPAWLDAMARADWINDYRDYRMPICGWQDPVLLERLNGLSSEIALLELIDILEPWDVVSGYWHGSAAQLEAELTSAEETRHKARGLLSWGQACGTYLSRLVQLAPGRIEAEEEGKTNRYLISRPVKS